MEHSILIVDDDEGLLSVLKNLFTDEGISVFTCSNGTEGIAKCRTQPFDLVITDIMMPGASGLEVLAEVRRIDPNLLVILITGYASLETAIQAIREGAYDYITKPFTLEEIRIAVRNALERVRLTRENRVLVQKLQEADEQLRLVREIMGSKAGLHSVRGRPQQAGEGEKTLIAGSMLPLHLVSDTAVRKTSLVLDLEKISQLRERGHITEREFELCKTQLFQGLK